MSDEEEESMSEGFSASEDEWKPSKENRGGESSDDDDSDFEHSFVGSGDGATAAATNSGGGSAKKKETKQRATKPTAIKKRKPTGQSLRTKLFNKYRPPPKTISSPTSSLGNNSPKASTSRSASKNARMPNESGEQGDNNDDSSSDSSVENYLVNPAKLDLRSSFFNAPDGGKSKETSPAPVFDCNAGMGNLSDSGSEDNNVSSEDEKTKSKAFDFRHLLEKANSLERAKENIAKRNDAVAKKQKAGGTAKATAIDVKSLLALGEKQSKNLKKLTKHKGKNNDDEDEDDDNDDDDVERSPPKLTKTKSTRVKRHTKTRPTSTVAAGDTDDSDFEEVADDVDDDDDDDDEVDCNAGTRKNNILNLSNNLEIHVEFPGKKKKERKAQDDFELALQRQLARDMRTNQVLKHKCSLLFWFARSYNYNRMLNDPVLLQRAIKLLPTANAYPPESGTEIKYFQSLITWFKTAIKLSSQNFYPPLKVGRRQSLIKQQLLEQIEKTEARCKQDMIFIFIILLRGMGLQCRLVVNMQPLPLKPSKNDLESIKIKRNNESKDKDEAKRKSKKESEEEKTTPKKEEKSSASSRNKNKSSGKSGGSSEKKKNNKEETNKKKANNEQKIKINIEENEKDKNKVIETAQNLKNQKKTITIIKKSDNEVEKNEMVTTAAKTTKVNTRDKIIKNSKTVTVITDKQIKENEDKKTKQQQIKCEDDSSITLKEEDGKVESLNTETLRGVKRSARLRSRQESREATEAVAHKIQKISIETTEKIIEKKPRISLRLNLSKLKQCNNEKQQSNNEVKLQKIDENSKTNEIGNLNNNKTIVTPPKVIISAENDEIPETSTATKTINEKVKNSTPETKFKNSRACRKSPKVQISTAFLQTNTNKAKFSPEPQQENSTKQLNKPINELKISLDFLTKKSSRQSETASTHTAPRILRSRQKTNELIINNDNKNNKDILPQLDGAHDDQIATSTKSKRPKLQKLKANRSKEESDEDFEVTQPKKPKVAPVLPKTVDKLRNDRRVLSTDDETKDAELKKKNNSYDMWAEVWCDAEEQWVCVDLFKIKIHAINVIQKAVSNLVYVFAFNNDLSIKDVTPRYCQNWSTMLKKHRVEKSWLDEAIAPYLGSCTRRDKREDEELRRIHEAKPMPTIISEYKDHPLYVLKRHLLKFQAIYPPEPPTLGFVRNEPVYARECVHTLHSREIWLKSARVVKLGEKPYKVVKARPKWDRLTQTVIKDLPLEIFGYWQTQAYEPPTAENGLVPRNAYGNVELFKSCMLPKKTVHLRLPGLQRICRKLGVDCANAVIGFDFHQGSCHPMYDGFVVCEEFAETVTAAWEEDQAEQERKEREKFEARVYGNWKKLIKGLLIRERLKKKYNF